VLLSQVPTFSLPLGWGTWYVALYILCCYQFSDRIIYPASTEERRQTIRGGAKEVISKSRFALYAFILLVAFSRLLVIGNYFSMLHFFLSPLLIGIQCMYC